MNNLRSAFALGSVFLASSFTLTAQTPPPAATSAAPAASASAPSDGVAPIPTPRPRASPHETISMRFGGKADALVIITYGRPYSKDPKNPTTIRKIWGGLVPWDKVWRTGSDEATTLVTPVALDMAGTTIPAGVYTLWSLPSEKGTSKLIISKQFGQWGLDGNIANVYDEKKDLARVDMKKDPIKTQVDQFTMALVNDPATGSGILKLQWETTQYSVAFTQKK